MILELYIENFILMDKVTIPFTSGFNVITGETGAGKSMVLGALNLLLGARFNKDLMKYPDKKTIIQGNFILNNTIFNILEDIGFDKNDMEDDMLIISRQWQSSGKQISRINGRIVPISSIKTLGASLVQIHGQHENQILLNTDEHINILDEFIAISEEEFASQIQNLSVLYSDIQNTKKRIHQIDIDPIYRQRQMELIQYQMTEIDDANLKDNEDELIYEELDYIRNFEKIHHSIMKSTELLSNDNGVETMMGRAFTTLQSISDFDHTILEFASRAESIYYDIQAISEDIRSYSSDLSYDEERLNTLENRLLLIEDLKRKYGNSISQIFEFYEDLQTQYHEFNTLEQTKAMLCDELSKLQKDYDTLAQLISSKRMTSAKVLEQRLMEEIHQLNMQDAIFKIDIQKSKNIQKNGYDNVQFMISTNAGQPILSIKKVISGGELSRIMLAIKYILGQKDDGIAMVFDEIDAGISGNTAHVVAQKLSVIARHLSIDDDMAQNLSQVICITHLPQIAAISDNHLLIEKVHEEDHTISRIRQLCDEQKIDEIVRLSGGDIPSKVSREHAYAIWEKAQKNKNITVT